MSKMRFLLLVAAVLAVSATAVAQERGRGAAPGRGPMVNSPEVRPDRTVTLRLAAPKAGSVTVSGEIMGMKPPAAMTRPPMITDLPPPKGKPASAHL